MSTREPPSPVIVPFGRGDSVVAHLYYGEDQIEVLKTLKSHSVHIVIAPITEGCHNEVARLLNQECGSPSGPDHFKELLEYFYTGCCPVCFKPWSEMFNVLTMENVVMTACNCTVHDGGKEDAPLPCVVLDFNAGDGTTAIQVLRAGLHYIGIETRPEIMGDACRRIQEAGSCS